MNQGHPHPVEVGDAGRREADSPLEPFIGEWIGRSKVAPDP